MLKKKQKAMICTQTVVPNLPRSGTRGVWGLAPNKPKDFFFFQKKKQKA
jgi:hypothetical protein